MLRLESSGLTALYALQLISALRGEVAEQKEPRRNPDWSRDETILALALYQQHRPRLPDDDHPDVVALSDELRALAATRGVRGLETFRNPIGVSMKLSNLRGGDPLNAGKGLPHGSATEDQVWEEFGSHPTKLATAAADIRASFARSRTPAGPRAGSPNQPPRIWVTGMWGYSPDVHGYVGFTNPGPRDRYLRECQPGDLMMIIGQNGETADPRDVGRLLGLVELEPRAVQERECMSDEAYAEKLRVFGADRWRNALPVKKAWKITREVIASQIATTTCSARNARAIGASCLLLTDEEVDRVLDLPSTPWRVWGQPDWAGDVGNAETHLKTAISRGPRPSFGKFEQNREDGETTLYAMRLIGPVAQAMPSRPWVGQALVKVGRSNDVKRRCEELNCGFPPGLELRWEVAYAQRFACADDAHDAEQRLLKMLEDKRMTIGREFAVVPEKQLAGLLGWVAEKSAFHIRAGTVGKPPSEFSAT